MIIGLCGLAGAGKTTVADHLVRHHGFVRVPFAGTLKAMAAAFGLSQREIAGDLKEVPCAMLSGLSPRQFMQRLGTEFGRQLIHEDVWVNAWTGSVMARCGPDERGLAGRIVADDVRFPNEVAAIARLGGSTFRLVRHGAGSATGASHASERPESLDAVLLDNSGSVDATAAALLRRVASCAC